MRILLSKWLPNRKFGKFLKDILIGIGIVLFLAFLVLPFCRFPAEIMRACKWIWLGCAVINLDNFAEYKRAKEQRIICPITTLYVILTFTYLYTYWHLLSLPVVICGSIITGIIEFTVSVSIYKTLRFTDKQKLVDFSPKIVHGVQLGGLYISSLALFVLGIFESKVLLYIFGGIALILLSVTILISLSNGFSTKKNILNLIFFVVDVLSFLALIIYLIYFIPEEFARLQSIITTIVAAVLGGALTLAGVAWTIKKTDKDRKEEEIKKYRPLAVLFNGSEKCDYEITLSEYDETRFVSFQKDSKNCCDKILSDFKLRNLDFSAFFIEGLIFNNRDVLFRNANLYIEKEKIVLFSFQNSNLYFSHSIQEIGVLVKDVIDNEYIIDLGFENEIQGIEKNCIRITGSKGIKEYKRDEGKYR